MSQNRILKVEDDKGISDGVAINLQYVGYEYVIFDDGSRAADCLEKDHSFELALLDIMLLSGFHTALSLLLFLTLLSSANTNVSHCSVQRADTSCIPMLVFQAHMQAHKPHTLVMVKTIRPFRRIVFAISICLFC